jgi:hypothetical protein
MNLGFSFQTTNQGMVRISRGGRVVTVLRGSSAQRFLAKTHDAPVDVQQQLMARITGNYKRGNEHE